MSFNTKNREVDFLDDDRYQSRSEVKHLCRKRNKPKRIKAAGVTQDLMLLLPGSRENVK